MIGLYVDKIKTGIYKKRERTHRNWFKLNWFRLNQFGEALFQWVQYRELAAANGPVFDDEHNTREGGADEQNRKNYREENRHANHPPLVAAE